MKGELPDARAPAEVGRAGRLELVFERRGERTVLAHQYAEPPLRVGAAFDVGDAVSLILVCSGPGIFAGDTLRQSVHVKSGARVVLASQSALQLHPSSAGAPARIEHAYRVDEDAELHCQWDPTIPFADARLEQRFAVDVAPGGRLYWSDALMAGRASRGEAWQFARVAHELELRVGGSLAYLERYALEPRAAPGTPHMALGTPDPSRAWVAGANRAFATALAYHPAVAPAPAEALRRRLDAHAGLRSGVDLLADRLLLVRLACDSGAVFGNARRELRQFALASLFQIPGLVDRK